MFANVRNNEIIDFNSLYKDEDIERIETTQDVYNAYLEDKDKVIYKNGEVIIDPDYEEKQEEKRRQQFAKDFFNTSLGYVRRAVHMKDGSVKDFLSDILPLIQVDVPIITYNLDGTQNVGVLVTAQFIKECKQQVLIDFYGAQNDL